MEQEPQSELLWTSIQRIGYSLRLAGHLISIVGAIGMATIAFMTLVVS